MDYSQVPGGALALRRLHERHHDIHLSYDAALELYTLYGTYSKVQAALTELFGQVVNQQSDAVKRATSGSWSEPLSQNPSEDLRANQGKQKEESGTGDSLRSPAEVLSSSTQRDPTADAYGGEDTGTTPQLTLTPEEDSLLIVDADMFQYLQNNCKSNYQQILGMYGVEAVDVTNQGFTSLYLQPAAGAGESIRDRKNLSLARTAISHFFQENETKVWRAGFLKSIFSSGKVLQMAKDNLSLRYPTILLKEDDKNVYMIGNSRDVSEAKQFIHDQSLDQFLKSEEDQTKDDLVRRCRLAPRFKESGLPPFGSRPMDFCLRGGTAQSRPKSSGPMLGFNVLSEPALIGDTVPGASPQITAEDLFFKSQSPLSPTASTQNNDSSFNADVIKSQPKAASLQDSALPPAGSESSLRRANSFSGTPQRKATFTQQRSQDDSNRSAAGLGPGPGAGASPPSPADHPSQDRQAGYQAEIQVSSMMWQHIKGAYSTHVDDLTSLQTRESPHGGSNTGTVSGANPSKLKSCKLGLQKLIDSVERDFSVHKLPLSELGLNDPADENLLACCDDVRNCFHTVTIQITRKNVLLLGPTLLCSQVAASLRSVFSKDFTFAKQEFSLPSTTKANPAILLQTVEGQSAEAVSEVGTGTATGTSMNHETRTNQSSFGETTHVNGSASQPQLLKDPAIQEKVKYTGAGSRNGHRSSVFVSKTGDNERENDGKLAAHPEEQPSVSAKERLDSSPKDSAHQRRSEREGSRSSAEAEPPRRGIKGRMTSSRLNISILGHKNDSTIKITYLIPDGIQQVRSLV